MRLNRELRTPSMIKRFNIILITSYFVLTGGVSALALNVYSEHNDEQLPPGHISLTINKQKFQLQENVIFTVTNNFPTTIYVTNSCPEEPLNVYRWQSGDWLQIHDKTANSSNICYKQPRRIPILANHSITYDYSDWKNIFSEPGVYRVAMEVDHYNEVPYQDFVILQPAEVIIESSPAPAIQIPAPSYEQQEEKKQSNDNRYDDDDDDDD